MIHTSLFKKLFTTFSCSALLIGGITMSATSAQAIELTNEEEVYLNELGFNKDSEFYKLMHAIEQLPAEKQSAEEVAEWLSNHSGLTITAEGEYLNFGSTFGGNEVQISAYSFSFTDIAGCIGALGGLIPVTKILKVHKLLDTLGGATKVMQQVLTNYKYYRKDKNYSQKEALGQALEDFSVASKLSAGSKQLFMDFFSISAIIGACGSLFSYENNKYDDEKYFFNENALKNLA
ncbi:hypothetical protein [Lysinibacillus pakistanensis]|uniref:Uncharacterized protein n=1 Tax=Lysinibacillus pakistanensis TaxID=759811 RepID=A0AAX3WPI8_9BACI|nr:hypothetical protein [Lysinibacillus pakistanensis]MDM5234008.1 hypothetical protein [Lysinibacillus pakistanensis]WHY44612.1 hypothetical protein QNH22_14905 [Lysinibacillus pakistanensis]WHY49620.1 hypothetical protein QNH24_14880 [Lysinibacillus pakistanensis]